MALNTLEQNTIVRAMQQAKVLVEQILPVLSEIGVIYTSAGGAVTYNGAGSPGTNIVQADLDSVSGFSGMTVQQLADGIFALATIKNDLTTAQSQLTQLAVRAS